MKSNWQNLYQELTGYVAQNPQIKLGRELIKIPAEYRPEFYRRFNEVRSAFVNDEFQNFVMRARPLQESYTRTETEVKSSFCLADVKITPQLRWYVEDPVDGLRRAIYDLLFDLIRDKISMESFVNTGRKAITSFERKLQQEGYQNWVLLSLLNLLKPEKIFGVSLDVGESSIATAEKALPKDAPVMDPQETWEISLEHSLYSIFIVPDVIFYSTLLKKYVSIRSEVNIADWTAKNASENMEWLDIDSNMLFTPGLILIYTHDNLNDLALVRDAKRIAKPDLALVCINVENWWEGGPFEEMECDAEIVQPKAGMHVLSRQVVPREILDRIAYQEVVSGLEEGEGIASTPRIGVKNIEFNSDRLKEYIDLLPARD
ncbi:MAG: hypothetical protein PHU52_00955 [Dehalococcoidales bacterium]|jgi:hypothetical protein|nr:hypothetical protein [Dehalococcoidales bacterium]